MRVVLCPHLALTLVTVRKADRPDIQCMCAFCRLHQMMDEDKGARGCHPTGTAHPFARHEMCSGNSRAVIILG